MAGSSTSRMVGTVESTAADYVRQLTDMGQYLERFSQQVLGYCVFTLGHYPPWGSYDISGDAAERLADYYSAQSIPTPTENHVTRIIDTSGAEHDEAWLRENFGAVIVRADQGKQHFALTEVQVTEGPATVIAVVKDSAGVPLNAHAVAFSWPDAPTDLTTPDCAVFKTRFKPRANVQWTDTNGLTGYGLGTGSYIYDRAVGGPHALWLLHNLYESDAIDKLGMLAGTNHVGPLRLTFALVAAAAAIGPLPESEPIMATPLLADKVRWWLEESVRQD